MSEVDALREAVRNAVTELDAEHYPMRYDGKPVTDDNAVGCAMCYPRDSSWPCMSRMIADDLRGARAPQNRWSEVAANEPRGEQ